MHAQQIPASYRRPSERLLRPVALRPPKLSDEHVAGPRTSRPPPKSAVGRNRLHRLLAGDRLPQPAKPFRPVVSLQIVKRVPASQLGEQIVSVWTRISKRSPKLNRATT